MTEKLFCTLMGHKWSNWTSESNSCTQSRKCNRQNCNAQDTRFIPHEWNDWFYYEDDSCKQIRKCKHCPESENKILHQWTDYQYERDNECGQLRTCTRCDAIEKRGPVHEWSTYIDSKRTCKRCNAVEVEPTYEDTGCCCEDIGGVCGMGCDPC